MLIISKNQWISLKDTKEQEFFELLIPILRKRFPVHLNHMDDAAMLHYIENITAKATMCGFETTRDIYCFIKLAVKLGASFYQDPQLPWVQKKLAGSRGSWENMTRLYARAYFHMEYMMGRCRVDFPIHIYKTLKTLWTPASQKTSMPSKLQTLLENVWPPASEYILTQSKLQTLFENIWLRKAEKLDKKILASLKDQKSVLKELNKTEFMILAFLLGSGFETDPAYPWSSDPDTSAELIWMHLDSIFINGTQGDCSNE